MTFHLYHLHSQENFERNDQYIVPLLLSGSLIFENIKQYTKKKKIILYKLVTGQQVVVDFSEESLTAKLVTHPLIVVNKEEYLRTQYAVHLMFHYYDVFHQQS